MLVCDSVSNKEKIFNVSIELFSKYGYDGVSIRQIAGEVGIKESSIYNHYKSKESILENILDYYISEMLKEEAPLMQTQSNLKLGFDNFYNIGSERFIGKLSEPEMMKITRIFLVESYHNDKIRNFVKKAIMEYAIDGWFELFELLKENGLIKKESDSRQLAESFYYYGLFLLYEHFIINYPEDDEKFLKEFERRTKSHMKLIYNSVKADEIIRPEEPKDYEEVENLVRNSFWNVYRPGAYEHYIVHNLRNDSSFIKELAYVIEKDGKIIGHINYSKSEIDYKDRKEDGVVLGPIAIDSDYQNQGYGTKLIEFTLKTAKKMNIPFIFVVGDENYYRRFGFESASKFNIYLNGAEEGECPFFMIKIFDNTKIGEGKGIFTNPDVFDVDSNEVDEFDKKFDYKEKKVTEGQLE